MDYTLTEMQRRDWSQVRAIYGEGLATGLAAFMKNPPKWQDWDNGYLAFGRTVARGVDGRVLGWAALRSVPDT